MGHDLQLIAIFKKPGGNPDIGLVPERIRDGRTAGSAKIGAEPSLVLPRRNAFLSTKPAETAVVDNGRGIGQRSALPSAKGAVTLIEFEAISGDLEFDGAAEAMATQPLLIGN
jgi:hypothetical protein